MTEQTIAFKVLPVDRIVLDMAERLLGIKPAEAARIIYLSGLAMFRDKPLIALLDARYSTARDSMVGQTEANRGQGKYGYDGDITGILDELYSFDESYIPFLEANRELVGYGQINA